MLENEDGPARRMTLANAAAALWAAEAVPTLRDGVAKADTALSSGHALGVLEHLMQG